MKKMLLIIFLLSCLSFINSAKAQFEVSPTPSGTWNAMYIPAGVYRGGALAADSTNNVIYVFIGGGTQYFLKYDVATNTWSNLQNFPETILEGAGQVYKRGGKKERGIRIIEPSIEDARGFLNKAKHNLEVADYLKKGNFTDWSVTAAYYAMYHVALAVLSTNPASGDKG